MKKINIDNIDKGTAFVVKWKYNLLSGFDNSLADAMEKANSKETQNLMKGFPEEMAAMHKYKSIPNWWNNILVELDLCPVLFL